MITGVNDTGVVMVMDPGVKRRLLDCGLVVNIDELTTFSDGLELSEAWELGISTLRPRCFARRASSPAAFRSPPDRRNCLKTRLLDVRACDDVAALDDRWTNEDERALEGDVRIVVRSFDSGVVLDLGPDRIAGGSLNRRLLLLKLDSAVLDADTGAIEDLGRTVGVS